MTNTGHESAILKPLSTTSTDGAATDQKSCEDCTASARISSL